MWNPHCAMLRRRPCGPSSAVATSSLIQISVRLGRNFHLQLVVDVLVRRRDHHVVQCHDAGQCRDAADEFTQLVVAAGKTDLDRQLGVEILGLLLLRFEFLLLQAGGKAGLRDIHQQVRRPRSCRAAAAAWRRRSVRCPSAAACRARGSRPWRACCGTPRARSLPGCRLCVISSLRAFHTRKYSSTIASTTNQMPMAPMRTGRGQRPGSRGSSCFSSSNVMALSAQGA